MFKKLLIAALAVFVGVAVLSGTKLGSHLRLNWNKARTWAENQVPLETEIDRLKMEVANLARDDDRYYDQVARQQNQVTKLRKKVSEARSALAKQESFIKDLREALAQEGEFVVFREGRQPRSRVESEVRSEALRFLADERVVKADEENLSILEETLTANKGKLENLSLQRKEMEAQLLVLERELAQQRLKDQSKLVVDDGRYGNLGRQIEDARERVSVLKTKSELRGTVQKGSLRAEEDRKAQSQQQDKEIEARFGPIAPKKVVNK